MKKTLFFIFLIFSVMTLNAEVFKSNQLGQKLEKADKVEEKGVYLVEEGYPSPPRTAAERRRS